MNENVRAWYQKAYPDDKVFSTSIASKLTFEDLLRRLDKGRDILIDDSFTRERVFAELAKRCNVDYMVIYNKWINN